MMLRSDVFVLTGDKSAVVQQLIFSSEMDSRSIWIFWWGDMNFGSIRMGSQLPKNGFIVFDGRRLIFQKITDKNLPFLICRSMFVPHVISI